jgi:hypothetical protein
MLAFDFLDLPPAGEDALSAALPAFRADGGIHLAAALSCAGLTKADHGFSFPISL